MKAEEEKEFAKKCEAAAELVFSRKKEVIQKRPKESIELTERAIKCFSTLEAQGKRNVMVHVKKVDPSITEKCATKLKKCH